MVARRRGEDGADATAAGSWPGHPRRWASLVVMMVCLVVVSLDNTILNVALKTIQADLDASQADMQWAVNAYTLVFAGLMFTFGLLGDRFGRKSVLLGGLALFGLASALAARTSTPVELIGARALMGVGAATILPSTLSIITNVFSDAQRAKAIGLWSASGGVGIAIGPLAGGYLLEHWWWGSIFLVNVPFVAIGLVSILVVVPDSRDPRPGRVDPLGVALSTAGIITLVYGVIRAGDQSDWIRWDVLGPLLGGIALLAGFVIVERRIDHPSLDVTLFRRAKFSAASVSVALVFFALMGLAFVLTYYLQAVRDASPLRAGVLILPAALGIAAGAPAAARLARPLGTKAVVATGMLLTSGGFIASAWTGRYTPTWRYESAIFAVGLGVGAALAPSTESVMSAVPRDRAGAGAAINSTMRLIGASLGVAVLGALLSSSYRTHLGGDVNVLPAGYHDEAAGSIGGTLSAVTRVASGARDAALRGQLTPAAGQQLQLELGHLLDRADDAFVAAMHVAVLCGAAVSLLGALVALLWLPGRPDRADDEAAGSDDPQGDPVWRDEQGADDHRAGTAGRERVDTPATSRPAAQRQGT